jgi:hypothetical protein
MICVAPASERPEGDAGQTRPSNQVASQTRPPIFVAATLQVQQAELPQWLRDADQRIQRQFEATTSTFREAFRARNQLRGALIDRETERSILVAFDALERGLHSELDAIRNSGAWTAEIREGAPAEVIARWVFNTKSLVRDVVARIVQGENEPPTFNEAIVAAVRDRLRAIRGGPSRGGEGYGPVYVDYFKMSSVGSSGEPYLAIVIDRQSPVQVQFIEPVNVAPFTREIKAAEDTFRAGDRNRFDYGGGESRSIIELSDIRRRLISPLRINGGNIDRYSRWLLSPSAATWLVPFSALPEEDGNYAILRREVSYVVSARDLIATAARPAQRPSVVVAGPSFDARVSPGSFPDKLAGRADARPFNSNGMFDHVAACLNDSSIFPSIALGLLGSDSFSAVASTGLFFRRGQRCRCFGCSSSGICGGVLRGPRIHGPPGTFGVDDPAAAGRFPTAFKALNEALELGEQLAARLNLRPTDPTVLFEEEATEAAFIRAMGRESSTDEQSAVVICTHGFYIPFKTPAPSRTPRLEDPLLYCGVALAGYNRVGPQLPSIGNSNATVIPRESDGVLLGREIVGMPGIAGRPLIFLIACEAGVGSIEGGQLGSLRHAFTLGGAQTIVATSWQVPVNESIQLSNLFFENWRDGHDVYEALHLAQKTLIEQLGVSADTGRSAHPYLWSGFSATGIHP